MSYLVALVQLNVFHEITVNYLLVGHTGTTLNVAPNLNWSEGTKQIKLNLRTLLKSTFSDRCFLSSTIVFVLIFQGTKWTNVLGKLHNYLN